MSVVDASRLAADLCDLIWAAGAPLATDARAGGAVVDEVLGDVPARSTTVGVRGVGTMLDAADRLARRLLLMDVDGDDAAQLLCGWPSAAGAASAVSRALPAHRFSVTGEPRSTWTDCKYSPAASLPGSAPDGPGVARPTPGSLRSANR